MDNTLIYIKMCKKAEKIQENWEENQGDSFIQVYRNGDYSEELFVCTGLDDSYYETKPDFNSPNYAIWLPHQDELQKIWTEHSKMKLPDCLPEFYYFAKDDVPGQFSTMEQLWLAFVMKEKYGERWDNATEEWVVYGDKG